MHATWRKTAAKKKKNAVYPVHIFVAPQIAFGVHASVHASENTWNNPRICMLELYVVIPAKYEALK